MNYLWSLSGIILESWMNPSWILYESFMNVLWILFESLLVHLGFQLGSRTLPKSDQNRFQEGSEIDPKYDRKKCCVWDRSLDDFWRILAPNFGGQGGPRIQVFGVESAPGATLAPTIPPGPLRDRVFVDLVWFWDDLGLIFGQILFDFCLIFCGCLVDLWLLPRKSLALTSCVHPLGEQQTWSARSSSAVCCFLVIYS